MKAASTTCWRCCANPRRPVGAIETSHIQVSLSAGGLAHNVVHAMGDGTTMNETQNSQAPGLWAKFVFYIGLIGLLALPLGALGTRFGVWDFGVGFNLLFGGVLLAVIALVLGVAGYIRAALRRRLADRVPMVVGIVASVVVLAWMGLQYNTAQSVPPIHDISTDRAEPPNFVAVVELRGPGTNSLRYEEAEAQSQAEGYPDLTGIELRQDVADTVRQAAAIAAELGWEVVNTDAEAGIVEATDTTFWFGFKDDVVVRVRPASGGSKVDVRSVSRIGQSDLGANAARIRAFLERLADQQA